MRDLLKSRQLLSRQITLEANRTFDSMYVTLFSDCTPDNPSREFDFAAAELSLARAAMPFRLAYSVIVIEMQLPNLRSNSE